jgi:hypothetical protein
MESLFRTSEQTPKGIIEKLLTPRCHVCIKPSSRGNTPPSRGEGNDSVSLTGVIERDYTVSIGFSKAKPILWRIPKILPNSPGNNNLFAIQSLSTAQAAIIGPRGEHIPAFFRKFHISSGSKAPGCRDKRRIWTPFKEPFLLVSVGNSKLKGLKILGLRGNIWFVMNTRDTLGEQSLTYPVPAMFLPKDLSRSVH